MYRIGEDCIEWLDIVFVLLCVVVIICFKYVCWVCIDGVIQVLMFVYLIEGGLFMEGVIVYVLVSKYVDYLLLYCQSWILVWLGVDIYCSILVDWVGVVVFYLGLVVDWLVEYLKVFIKLFMDEIMVLVFDFGCGWMKIGYFWVLVCDDCGWGGVDLLGVVFFYVFDCGGQNVERFLCGFDGILQFDGYMGYNCLICFFCKGGDLICVVYCWVYVWCKLKEVFDCDGFEIVVEGLCCIVEVYVVEVDICGCFLGQWFLVW